MALEDVVAAHLLAVPRAPALRFGRFIISATTPFEPADAAALRHDAAEVLERRVPGSAHIYRRLGWRMAPTLDRVYDNTAARQRLGWEPGTHFRDVITRAAAGQPLHGALVDAVGRKGYHGGLG